MSLELTRGAYIREALNRPKITDRVMTKQGLWLFLISSGISLLFDNGLYLYICLITVTLLVYQLWRFGKPGILLFAFLYQWVQVIAFVLWMNNLGRDIDYFSHNGGIAVLESCVGLIIMGLIINFYSEKVPMINMASIEKAVAPWDPKQVLIYYVISTVFFSSIGFVLGSYSGFTQVLITISAFKWIFFTIYAFIVFAKKGSVLILIAMILFEFATGLYSYFSSFKEVLFFSIIVVISLVRRISFKQFFTSVVCVASLAFLMLTWTIIKGKYREFLNQGRRQQTVVVSQSDAFSQMQEQLSGLTWQSYADATNLFLYRIQYVLHLAKTMDRVPAVLPHEYGQLWLSNITFVITPRLLYPDKPTFQATIKTNKYTGFHYSGLKQGTSFSLGYFADSYVDFGHILMYIPLILIAVALGSMYVYFMRMRKLNLLFRIAIINFILYNFISFEADGTYLIGRLLITFLTMWFFCKIGFPTLQKLAYRRTD